MRKFNIIKKSRKKSKDIDEKIEYLNKECQKTGLQEVMTTSNIYVKTKEVPNTTYTDFQNTSIGGYALALSGADGNGAGGAIIDTIPSGFSLAGVEGVALSPPHPITGERTYATHILDGIGTSHPLQPGKSVFRGFSNKYPTTMGGALWFFDSSYNFGGQQGRWLNFEWFNGGWGFWDTSFLGFYFHNQNLDEYELNGVNIGTQIKNQIAGINFGNTGVVGTPTTTVFVKNDLGDPGFLPINIDGVSIQAFNYLKGKAGANVSSSYYSPEDKKNVINYYKKLQANPNYQPKPYERESLIRQMRAQGDGTQIASTDPSAAFPSSLDAEEITSADIPDEFKTDSQDKSSTPSAQGVTLTKWMSRSDFIQLYPDSSMVEYLSALPYGATDFMTPKPGYNNAWELNTKGYENYFMYGDLSALGNKSGTPKPRHSKATPEPEKKKWGGKTHEEILAELDADIERLTAAEKAAHEEMRAIAFELGADFVSLIGGLFTGGTTAAPVLGKIGMKLLKKYGKTVAGKMIRKLLKRFRNKKNNNQIDDIIDSIEKGGNESGSADFPDDGIGPRPVPPKPKDKIPSDMEYNWNPTGGSDGRGQWEVRDIPSSPKLGDADFLPVNANLPPKPSAKLPAGFKYKWDPKAKGGQGQWIVVQETYKTNGALLTEAAKLGHFEPEALTVDLEKLRKGIMPEFPKDPPPEMIGGYSAKSRLVRKEPELPPFIKVTKKDLARSHKLTDKEISDFMNDIKMINDYIKKNPAELKYAMIRYPKDDPRLAQLNFNMDQMKAASDEYMDTHFPENQKLFNKLQDKIIRNIKQTDPKNFKGHKEAPKFTDEKTEVVEQRKKTVLKYFKKPVKIKKPFKY